MRLRWSPEAAADIEKIIEWAARDNRGSGRALARKIHKELTRLCSFPFSWRRGRVSGTRELVIGLYNVVYRLKDDEVIEIVRIYPYPQDWP